MNNAFRSIFEDKKAFAFGDDRQRPVLGAMSIDVYWSGTENKKRGSQDLVHSHSVSSEPSYLRAIITQV